MIKRYCEFLAEIPNEDGLKSVMTKIGNLYSLWRLNNHVGLFYQGMTIATTITFRNIILLLEQVNIL